MNAEVASATIRRAVIRSGAAETSELTESWVSGRSVPVLGGRPRRGDERCEEGVVGADLGVPLDRQAEARARSLHRLQRAVDGPGHGVEPRMGVHRLMMVAAHVDPLADRGAQPGPLRGADRDPAELRPARTVLVVTDEV